MASLLLFTMILVSASVVLANLVDPMITPPAILPRGVEDQFVGWYSDQADNSYYENSCSSGYSFYTSGSLVGCCDTMASEDCATQIVTSCSGAIALSVGGSQRCTSYCNADTVYTSSTADASAFLWIGCNDETGVLYFQVKPATTNHVTFDSTVRSRASSNSPSTTPSLAGQTASPTPTKASEPAAASKAWIAGVVVGGLALVAIAGLVFWLLRTRKRSKGQGYHSTPETAPYPQQYQIGHQTTLPAQPYYSSSPNQPQVHPQQDYKGQFVTTPPTQGETYKHNPNYTSVKVTIPGELSPQNNPIAELAGAEVTTTNGQHTR